MRLDHAVEGLARLDHAELAARAFLDRGLAGLEVLDVGGERVVALLQARVLRLLPGHGAAQRLRLAPAALAPPQLRLQPGEQQGQDEDGEEPAALHRAAISASG